MKSVIKSLVHVLFQFMFLQLSPCYRGSCIYIADCIKSFYSPCGTGLCGYLCCLSPSSFILSFLILNRKQLDRRISGRISVLSSQPRPRPSDPHAGRSTTARLLQLVGAAFARPPSATAPKRCFQPPSDGVLRADRAASRQRPAVRAPLRGPLRRSAAAVRHHPRRGGSAKTFGNGSSTCPPGESTRH